MIEKFCHAAKGVAAQILVLVVSTPHLESVLFSFTVKLNAE